MKHASVLVACVTAMFCVAPSLAQEASAAYPNKPIRFIVPYAAGGGTDIVARAVGEGLGAALGVAVVIDNRPGAGGTIGTALAASAPPDGYTMVLSGTSTVLAANLYKKLPYDAARDLEPVSLVATQPSLLVVNPLLPVRSVKEVVALAKAKPGFITYASGGNGAANHMATELFKLLAGIDLTHIPYKGTGPAVVDLLGGQVNMTISPIASLLSYVKSGQLIAIGVTGTTRVPALPDVPTIAEAGVKGYEFTTWYGIQLPAKTPPAIVKKLHDAVASAVASAKVREQYATVGLDAVSSTPEEFHAFIATELAKWAKVAKAAHITIQ